MRVIIMRSMLLLLFVACANAILSIFATFQNDIGSRLVGSSVLLAIGCGVLLPITPKTDTQRLTPLGLTWICVVAFEVIGGLALIWGDLLFLGNTWFRSEGLALSMFIIFCGIFVTAIPLRQIENIRGPLLRIAKFTVVLIWLLTIVIAIAAALLSSGRFPDKLMGSWLTLLCGIIVALCCICGLIPGIALWRKALALIGLIATSVAIACWMYFVLSDFAKNTLLLQFAFLTSGIAAGLGILSIGPALPLGRVESRLLPWITIVTIIAGWCAASMASAPSQFYGQLLSATLVLDGCLGLTVIIFYVIGRRAGFKEWIVTGASIECPRCGKKSKFAIGEHPCSRCGFQVLIAFRDIKCARCQQDVRHIPAGNPCPECGLAVENSAANYLLAGATGTEAPSA